MSSSLDMRKECMKKKHTFFHKSLKQKNSKLSSMFRGHAETKGRQVNVLCKKIVNLAPYDDGVPPAA